MKYELLFIGHSMLPETFLRRIIKMLELRLQESSMQLAAPREL